MKIIILISVKNTYTKLLTDILVHAKFAVPIAKTSPFSRVNNKKINYIVLLISFLNRF